jgi:hypothetical protein
VGCLSDEEKEEFLKGYRERREARARKSEGRRQRAREAALAQDEPYRRRVLSWAADNWDAVEVVAHERFVTGEEPRGLFGAAFSLLPPDLKTELDRIWLWGEPNRPPGEEDRERAELRALRLEERTRTGSPLPRDREEAPGGREETRRGGQAVVRRPDRDRGAEPAHSGGVGGGRPPGPAPPRALRPRPEPRGVAPGLRAVPSPLRPVDRDMVYVAAHLGG